MSEFDDIDGEEGASDAEVAAVAVAASAEDARGTSGAPCISCGNPVAGPFCSWCGQKDDDLRRSSFILARDFLEDTFGFDSRMWRTLGLMAIAPGLVPKNYAHGKRSRFTPPVRLFIVVSFLFFVALGLTNTLFVGLEVRALTEEEIAARLEASLEEASNLPPEVANEINTLEVVENDCNLQPDLRFFVKESDVQSDMEALNACFSSFSASAKDEIETVEDFDPGETDLDRENLVKGLDRVLNGVSWAVENPRAFNDAINTWLPRVMFVMTPILALILTLFIRGRDALVFDHLIFSFYTHAAAFAIIATALILAQFGVPYTGIGAFAGIALYYVTALKRDYDRGWIKTAWTALVSGLFYWMILLSAVTAIVSNIIWRATGA